MRIVQDYLRELDRAKLMEAYFEYAEKEQGEMFSRNLFNEEQEINVKYDDMDVFIQYLADLKPEPISNGKNYILFAYPDYEI